MRLFIDFLLWKYIVPFIKAGFFKNRLVSIVALSYVSVYRLPRRFLLHYFRGKGIPLTVDSKSLIGKNPLVVQTIKKSLEKSVRNGIHRGNVEISQTLVFLPGDKYSVGSFSVNYQIEKNTVILSVRSHYRFAEFTDRITKHLHAWMSSIRKKGKASDFEIKGNDWVTSLSALQPAAAGRFYKKFESVNYLLV